MTRKQAKMFARIHSAALLNNADGFMFMDRNGNTPIPTTDEDKILAEIGNIADKIQGDLPEMSNSFDIYKYVIENF